MTKIPTAYAHVNATVTVENSFSIRFKSVKCVSSILNPPDFNALKAVSICHRSL